MKNHFLIGLASGLVGGAVYGLLTTEHTGEENRTRVKTFSEDVKRDSDVFKQDLEKVIHQVQEIQQVGLPLAQEFSDDMQVIASDYQTELEPRMRRIQERVDAIENSAQDFQEKTEQ